MDTLTHGLAGALLGRAAAKEDAAAVTTVSTLAAMFPDCDAFFLPGHWFSMHDTLGYLQYHRGVTHSFVLAPLFAAAIAGLAKPVARRTRYPVLLGAALLGILSHILFDWITSYGTMFFAPVSWRRYWLDWVFILDPFFTGILIVAFVIAAFLRPRARRVAAAGSLALFAYIAFCATMHARAVSTARRLFPGAAVAALPQPFSPLRWALFGDRGDEVGVAYVRLGGLPAGVRRQIAETPRPSLGGVLALLGRSYAAPSEAAVARFATRRRDPAVVASRGFPDAAAWFRFARFPIASIESLGPRGTRVILTDLRFRGPWGHPAFQFEVVVSPLGSEIASGFVRLFTTDAETKPR